MVTMDTEHWDIHIQVGIFIVHITKLTAMICDGAMSIQGISLLTESFIYIFIYSRTD